ncbi:MAG: cyclohexadienyl dehydratase [Rickettsiales bacterium]|nr:cyclohexadienyl dehydratase [Rickettsiales bacterium]|tara:strand:+ start:2420 stop:3184 length:765 start_codon:yes stop_codon:yes gene_type:complete
MILIRTFLITLFLILPSLASASTLDEIMKSGTLKVGTTGDFPGWSFMNPETSEYEGYDIDVAMKLAEDMGVEVEFVATDWKNLVSGVVANKYHMTSSASITAKRAITAGYSNSYYGTGTVAMVLSKNKDKIFSWDQINNSDYSVAVTLGTVFENEATKSFPDAKLIAVEAPAREYQEVLSGRADVSLTSKVDAMKLVQLYPELSIVNLDEPKNAKLFAILLPRGDQEWINFVNHWIADQKNKGFFNQTAAKFGL